MKRLFLLAICALTFASAMGQLKWVDATTLNICGHTIRNAENPYSRIETKPYGFTNKAIIRYSQYSTGLYVMFKTNSTRISAEWSLANVKIRDNMTPIVQLGVDLYVKGEDGKMYLPHTLNNTVVAPPRMLIAFLENHLQADGSVTIPAALRPYMGGQEVLVPKK